MVINNHNDKEEILTKVLILMNPKIKKPDINVFR